ncbi:hypothetical protein [Streptomyces sp. enrichment culture]|uniref:hypothetical protein n=1 Tax=Streptomyces sp. enrichment culture TaxID=1795815 RepID=UPI003F574D78
MTADEAETLQLLADKPREMSAFAALLEAIRNEGHQAELLGSPERQRDLYPFTPPIPVDAEVAVNGVAGFVDHTVLPAPQEDQRRVATQDAVAERLIGLLTDLAAEAPGGGLIVNLAAGPWMGVSRRAGDRLYAQVVDMASKAVERGKPFVDMRRLPRGPFPVPTIDFWPCPDEQRVIISFTDLTSGWSGRLDHDGRWRFNINEIRPSIGRAIEGKLRKQLAGVRAVATTRPIGLLIDSRPMLSPGKKKPEPVFDLPPFVVSHLIHEIAQDWPGVLSKAWLLSPLSGVTAVYGEGSDLSW